MATQIHPAITVTNIRTFIPITLDNASAQYVTWSELFRIHCTAYQVAHHLQPRVALSSSTSASTSSDKDKASAVQPQTEEDWNRIDAIVLQWIYGTISIDLIQTIMKKNTTAYDAWTALENLFQDNKSARALHLQLKPNNTRLESFEDMASYCQEVKILANQLSNVDVPLSQTQLVLQVLGGFTDQYRTIATVIRSTNPLPDFNGTRSQLCQEETEIAARALHATQTAGTALQALAKPDTTADNPPNSRSDYSTDRTYSADRGRGRNRGRGRGRGRNNYGRDRGGTTYQQYTPWDPLLAFQPGASQQAWQQWPAMPPCPYPMAAKTPTQPAQGILGPRPAQAYPMGYVPTDIDQAFQTMSLYPLEQPWYMDTGATNHMTNRPGSQDQGMYPPQQ
ncbi:uncharacterized protein LOC143597593 [Bidens hawaiensis]|uniref:uncharacterized protein LOC143597593 n=1 Tax=Bidens hawaiensis TaxID=980011 RepID=UPI00404A5342